MAQLEVIDRENWREFLAAPAAVLMLGKTDCESCRKWTVELTAFLDSDESWNHVRFGKLELDRRGLVDFKRENTWIAELTDLPYNVIYVDGERKKWAVNGGVTRTTLP